MALYTATQNRTKKEKGTTMTDKLLCPFCRQELVIPKEEIRNGIQCCVCRNPKCEFDGWHFPVKLVQELITTRKALDVALDALDNIKKNCMTMIETEGVCGKALGQIKNKEQQ